MYANQVVQFLERKNENLIAEMIKRSQKFHFGQIDKLPNPNRITLFEDFKKYIKVPFPLCWFDFYSYIKQNFIKAGFLLVELPEGNINFHLFHNGIDYPGNWIHDYIFSWDQISIKTMTDIDNNPISPFENEYIFKWLCWLLSALENSILLLNCKNIELVKNYPELKHIEKRIKKGIKPAYTYYTLKLKLPAFKKPSTQQQLKAMYHNRLHFCRGHFKEYTDAAPLFGKITGLWWWGSYIRGQDKQGLIEKEYEIQGR